uniref:Tonsoku-like protein n=1 Tax=Gouania willdenowi TaxID=441366 RepID=A0A8C5N824_GOUWI
MSSSREIKQLHKAKVKAQASRNLKEEANICNQLGEMLARIGDYEAAIQEHQQELSLSEVLNDVIGRAVANRKIGECYAEMGNIEAALKHQRCHLDLARSVRDHAEEQRALATIGRTYLFRYETDQSKNSLKHAADAFRKSLAIVDDRLEGTVPQQEISVMKARLFLNLGLVCDHLGESKRCSEFIRRSVFIAERGQLLEDLYRANFNLGNICFRNGQHSNAVRCLEQAKDCAKKIKDKFSESECFHCIGKVQLSLGDFVAARRSLKKALMLGSQQPLDRQAVKKSFRYADLGCKLEEELGEDQGSRRSPHQAVELAEQLGDLYCKVSCYNKALDAYQAQLKCAEALGKPGRELAVIHVSLAATYTDLRQHHKAVEHYRKELDLRQGSSTEECSTWLNIATAREESGCDFDDVDHSYETAFLCAQTSGQSRLQRVLRLWLASQRRSGSSKAEDTEARLKELCAAEGWCADGSDGEEDEEEEMENSEPLEDSDVILSDSDDDLEGYDKVVTGRRKAGRWNKRNEKGETSLHRACIDGNLKQVQYLVEQGHPVNPRDYCGWTPLHEACNHGHYEIVALLLERGANVNDPGGPLCEGVTPLHDALTCGNLNVARLLVERGASVTLRNSKGETAMDTLHKWQRMYSRELDQDTRQECSTTERLIRKALAGGVPAAPVQVKPFDALQDSQLFDAENSEPLMSRDQTPNESTIDSSSNDSDSDSPVSPLRPVRPRHINPTLTPTNTDPSSVLTSARDKVPDSSTQSVFARPEYHSTIRSLGSAKSLLWGLSEPQLSSTPAVPSSRKSALVPEDEYLADDWLEHDVRETQPKKKRRLQVERSSLRGEDQASCSEPDLESSRRGEVHASLPPPIRVRVRVHQDVFLIPVPQSEADLVTVSWLCEQAAQRYYQKCGLLPRLSLQKEGALLSAHDHLLSLLHTNEEVLAEVLSWDLPPLPERYKKACQSLAAEENKRVMRLCEVQDGSPSVTVSGLSLAPPTLTPLLRALKLQACLTELRLSGNRLPDGLVPELVATAVTMPRLRVLDISANCVTGEGLEKAANATRHGGHDPKCLEELDLSLNPLGDGVSESLSRLLSSCPLLAHLRLQACKLTARFLQQHRLLLANSLTGTGHLKSICLSHNALGATGLELVLKTLPLHCLTHLDLSGVRRGPTDFLPLDHLVKALTQDECSLSHLSLAANGLTDNSVASLARCLPLCPTLVSLNLSANPCVTTDGFHSLLTSVREAGRPLTLLNIQGCQVSGPWDSESLTDLSELVQDLRLCSQSLNKLDRRTLKHSWNIWNSSRTHAHFLDRNAKFLLSTAASL